MSYEEEDARRSVGRRNGHVWGKLGQVLHQDPVYELLEDFRRAATCDIEFRHIWSR
jgi:hypothetical protein